MKPDNAFMLELTANMPCKQIYVNNVPYLQRYYAGTFYSKTTGELDLWFHRFLSCDGEEHLHFHPMNMESRVLVGWYEEEYLELGKLVKQKFYARGELTANRLTNLVNLAQAGLSAGTKVTHLRPITMDYTHRISEIAPETWTILFVKPERLPVWGFVDSNGEIETRKPSPREWWREYKPRGFNYGDVCT